MVVGFGFAWAVQKMGPPTSEPRPELVALGLAGVVLLFISAIVNRVHMGASKTRNGRRMRGVGSGKLPEPVRGWRRLGTGLLLLGIGGLCYLLVQGSGAFGGWMTSGAAIVAGGVILVRLRATVAEDQPRAN